MKESYFIRQNQKKWSDVEARLKDGSMATKDVIDTYRDILADLSVAQTEYPTSRVVTYLNNIAQTLNNKIYTPRSHNALKEAQDLLLREVPMIIADARKEILMSLGVFMFFVIGGVIMAIDDPQNVVQTLGENYVNTTIENINNGVPTNIYSEGKESESFISILLNNVLVDVRMYMYGIFPLIGTVFYLFYNGVMLGEFQTLFFLHGVGLQSMTAIWIHGTLEISALIIAGGASFALARSWLNARTYTLADSIRLNGTRSIKILLSTFPLTLTAAFLEGYVTRHVEWPLALRLGIIVLSAIFVIAYYILMPYYVWHKREMEGVKK